MTPADWSNSSWRDYSDRSHPDAGYRTPEDRRALEAALVADLRARSDRFTELWDSGVVGQHETTRKTIDHPQVGPVTLDCDILTVAGSDLRIMI